MLDSPPKLLLALLTGFLFGFLLQKGRVAKFEVIIGQLLLRDCTVAKIMITAIAVGSIGVYALVTMGAAGLHVKPALLSGVVVGGILFGCGMAVLGYCPGTTVVACREGHRDALFGLAGMLAGALTYVWFFGVLEWLSLDTSVTQGRLRSRKSPRRHRGLGRLRLSWHSPSFDSCFQTADRPPANTSAGQVTCQPIAAWNRCVIAQLERFADT
jgi:uncharacterized protein